MLSEYLKYWGLSKPPFSLTPDPEMLYMSKQHQEGLIRLKYAVVSNKGGALLISENAGDGKTSLLAKLRLDLNQQYQGRCHVVFIDHPTLTANQMVGEIARQLGVGIGTTDKLSLLNELRRFLLECHQRDEKCVVMLDEGQMLRHRPDLLQELRILLNFCVSDAFLLTFILSGQRPLDEAIRAMPEFYQRLPVRFFLRNLNREDTRELIRYRLRQAGNPPEREIFSEDGYTGIFNFSKGCPRIICSVADLSLVIAHSRYSKQVDFVSVSQACSDMNRTEGGYHYYYFLKSFNESLQSASQEPAEKPQLPGCCPHCSGEVDLKAQFCPHCGTTLSPRLEEKPLGEKESPALEMIQKDKTRASEDDEQETKLKKEEAAKVVPIEVPLKFSLDLQEETPGEEIKKDGVEQSPLQVVEQQREPDKVKCPFCGLILRAEVVECPNCGEKLKETEESSTLQEKQASEKREKEGEKEELGGDETPPGRQEFVELEQEKTKAAPEREDLTCSVCGFLTAAESAPLCSRCGSPLNEPSYEQEFLQRIEKLSMRNFILSKSFLHDRRPPDPQDEELVFFPLGKFGARSAVLQFSAPNGETSFVTRCGLIFTASKVRFVFTDGVKELDYEMIEKVNVEPLKKNGLTLLYQLVLDSSSGSYRILLPFRASISRPLSDTLRSYLTAKLKALTYLRARRKEDKTENVRN